MTTMSLPEQPNLEHLRGQARALQRRVRAADPEAVARVVRHYDGGAPDVSFPLSTAQLVLAREYGFASWSRLRQYLDLVAELGWDGASANRTRLDPADEFCRLACLTYGDDDGPDRWARAGELLSRWPDLTANHVWAAACAGDAPAVSRLVEEDPARVHQRGGPNRWRPLCYLAYSRTQLDESPSAALCIARTLLDAGADPNEGYLWNGQPYAFTVLTGVFGEGELGPTRQPRHPHAQVLARVLLEAGADANDGQALYNRMFTPDNDHLELLFEFGLGRGDGGVWKARMGDLFDSPSQLLRGQLRWAVEHDLLERVRLLVRHGADFRSPYPSRRGHETVESGPTLAELAAVYGHGAIADYLVAVGATPPDLDPVNELVGAAFRVDRRAVARIRRRHPEALADAVAARPGLIVWAASRGRADAVAFLAELGFDVNARGRGDAPVEEEWETGLHHAAAAGDGPLVRLLLKLGADPNERDARFGSTPLGWALHFGRTETAEILAPLTDE